MLGGVLLVAYVAFVIVNGTLAAVSPTDAKPSGAAADARNERNNRALFLAGRNIFRNDTFGDQAFWGDALQLHRAIAGAKNRRRRPGPQPEGSLGRRGSRSTRQRSRRTRRRRSRPARSI